MGLVGQRRHMERSDSHGGEFYARATVRMKNGEMACMW